MAGDGASIGTLYADVEPRVVAGFWARVVSQAQTQARAAGDTLGAEAAKGIQDRIAKGVVDGVQAGGRSASGRAAKAGEESGGSFAEGFRKRVEAALRSLPKAQIGASATEAEQKLKDLRAELESLSGKRIGIDVDDATALAQLDRIRTELERLGADSPSVQVRTDTAAAAAQLAKVQAEVDRLALASPTITVDADTGAAQAEIAAVGAAANISTGGLQGLISVGIALGPAIVPAAAAAAAAIAAIGPAALVGGAGVGVMALAFVPVVGALKAADAAQQSAGTSAASAAGKQFQLASAADAVRSAQASLGNTIASAADSQRRASESVANAVTAEAGANRQLLVAQQAVTQARIDATRAAEDLSSRVAHNALDQQQAALDTTKAEQALAAARRTAASAPTAANQQAVREAELALRQQQLRVSDLQTEHKRLAEDKAKSDKAGVDGSTQVVAAVDRVRAATEAVHKAEQATADARAAYATQARQSAFAIAQAQQGVVNAQRSLEQATVSAGNSGGAAMNKLNDAMSKLSPAGVAFVGFLQSLKPRFDELSKAAQTGLLPGLQAGMQALLPVLPQISAFVGQVARAFGEFFATIGRGLADPFWSSFFQQIGAIAGPMLQNFATIILSLARAFATLLLAFIPLSAQMGSGLANLAVRFATFVGAWTQSNGFTQFIDYVKANGPILLKLFGDLIIVTVKLAIALAPLGELILKGLTAVVGFLAALSPGQLIAIAAAIGAIIIAVAVMSSTVTVPLAALAAGVVAVVAALVYAYTHWQLFRQVVDFVVQAYVAYVQTIVAVTLFLWHNVLVPAWAGIQAAISAAMVVISPILQAFGFVITNFLGPALLFFWRQVVVPTWQGIQAATSVAWAIIQVVFGLMQIGLKILGAAWSALYTAYIQPVWEGRILPLLRVVGAFIGEHVAPAWRGAIDALGQIFDGLREKIKAPVRFVIETVLNNGLLGAYNWIASRFGVKPDNVSVTLPRGFARGGYIDGPGGPTDDAILARLSAGEFVIPARVVSALGVDFFNQLIGSGARRPQFQGDGSEGLRLPGFAEGGLVGWLKGRGTP